MSDTTFLYRFIDKLNKDIFFREFSFSQTKFTPPSRSEVELADHVVRIGKFLFLYQCKERSLSGKITIEKWLKKKVKKASEQMKETIRHLNGGYPIPIKNSRGHIFDLAEKPYNKPFCIVLFKTGDNRTALPFPRFYRSHSMGCFIHIFDEYDYFDICKYLLTPSEISDYLYWREKIFQFHDKANLTSEMALVGQYLIDDCEASPDERYKKNLIALNDNPNSFDLSYLFHNLGDHIEKASSIEQEKNYYPILRLIAQMDRTGLHALKERITISLKAAKNGHFEKPLRYYIPKMDCGFVVIPILSENCEKRINLLKNFTIAAKYDGHVSTQIGISIAYQIPYILIDWCYASFSWLHDPVLEKILTEKNPFRPVNKKIFPRYQFATEKIWSNGLCGDDIK